MLLALGQLLIPLDEVFLVAEWTLASGATPNET